MTDSVIICDDGNRRIVQWRRQSGASMDSDGFLYASDCKKHEVTRWRIGDVVEVIVAGGDSESSRLDQLSGST